VPLPEGDAALEVGTSRRIWLLSKIMLCACPQERSPIPGSKAAIKSDGLHNRGSYWFTLQNL